MPVEVWRFERSSTSHESAALLHLARELEALPESFLMIIHPVFSGQEIDTLVFKKDMVFVVEIKSAHGPVVGEIYGAWHVVKADGTTVSLNAGREDNPFWQVQKHYFATRDFLEEHKTAFMTESEAAVTDFKKIKNVLVFDPEYDEEASDIRLGGDAWKLNLVGLHNNVGGPFFTLRHDAINLSGYQVRTLAQDVLHCHFAEDYDVLLHPEVRQSSEETSSADQPALEKEEEDVTHPMPSDASSSEDVMTSPESQDGSVAFLSRTLQKAKQLWTGLREQTGEGKRRVQTQLEQERERWRATHKIDFERLLHELYKAADGNVHHLTPDTFVANYYTVHLDTYSYRHVKELRKRYQTRATAELRRYIFEQGYRLDPRFDRIVVQIEEDSTLTSQINVHAEYKEAPPIAIIEGSQGQSRALYRGDALTVGREEGADFRICDNHAKPVISRKHCFVAVSDDGTRVTVRDRSTNGTFVNGERTQFTPLSDGDVILLGRNKRDEEGPTLYVSLNM
jgi:hypothetical protein